MEDQTSTSEPLWVYSRKDKLIELQSKGLSVSKVANAIRISPAAVQNDWNRFYCQEHGSWYGQRAWTEERQQQLFTLRNEGKSQSEVAEIMGCSAGVIYMAWMKYLKKEFGSWKVKANTVLKTTRTKISTESESSVALVAHTAFDEDKTSESPTRSYFKEDEKVCSSASPLASSFSKVQI